MPLPPPSPDKKAQEFGPDLAPRFDANGLVTAITIDHTSRRILMVAFMNDEAVQHTLDTGYATYWSRSRQKLWKKGESSGELQVVKAIYVDCDQDALLVEVDVEGRGTACHNGFESCFYRKVRRADDGTVSLETFEEPKVSVETLYGSNST